jgi:hypothetical protein
MQRTRDLLTLIAVIVVAGATLWAFRDYAEPCEAVAVSSYDHWMLGCKVTAER